VTETASDTADLSSPTTTEAPSSPSRRDRVARVVTEVFAPAVLATVMPVVMALHDADSWPAAVGWAVVAVIFCSAIPYGVILVGVRRGWLSDRHIGRREQRLKPLLVGIGSVITGLGLLVAFDAPDLLTAMVAVMLVVLAGIAAVNTVWKLSAHAGVAAGSLISLVLVFGPWMLVATPLVALVAWSRVQLTDHTTPQVIAGTVMGASLAAIVWLPMM